MVKRYFPSVYNRSQECGCDDFEGMGEDENGAWVYASDYAVLAAELVPCTHEKAFRKTITTNDGTVFVCEVCSHHWYRTWAQINTAVDAE